MKKGLFIAFEFSYNENIDKISGIEKKIYFQIQTFIKYGYKMDFYNPYVNRRHNIEKYLRRLPFHYLLKWKFNYNKINEYDFIYIRKQWFMDGDLIKFLKNVKKVNPSIKILIEVPTYPYDSEGKKWDMIPLKIKDKKWRKQLYKYVDRIVTYSDDPSIFNIPTICIPNAIDYNTYKRNCVMCNTPDVVNIMACASLYYWHGYDRAIEGLYHYVYDNTDDKQQVHLFIVGDGAEYEKYKKKIIDYKLEEYVTLAGPCYGHELDRIYDKCVIGLDSMGRHRSGVYYNSSLKGKEYCAKGLIIVSGVKTELDLSSDYPYYYRIPADDTPLDFYSIIRFYNELLGGETIEKIQNNIMEYAKEHYDFEIALKPVQEYLRERDRL